MTLRAATDSEIFRSFVTDALRPVLREEHIVVMDNLQPHKAAGVRQIIESTGAQLIYLPPYSPDFNPIEPAWSKIKQQLRSLAARTLETLGEGVAQALKRITPQDARGYFRHCGYATSG